MIKIRNKRNITNRLGEMSKSKYGTPMKIIRYIDTSNVTIEFQDEYKVQRNTTYTNFRIGQVRNPYDKTVYGIGYDGEGKYTTTIDGFGRYIWHTWRKMIERCYEESLRWKYPAYVDCTICKEWRNYQNFTDWYLHNYYNVFDGGRMHIDKDIIKKDNKLYCPEYCLIVPQRINMIFMTKAIKDDLPNAIKQNVSGTYVSFYNGINYGTYETLEEAVAEHDRQKRLHIRNVVEEYGDKLPSRVSKALLAW